MNLFRINIFSTYLLLILISCVSTANNVMVSFQQVMAQDTLAFPADTISITAVGDVMIGSAYPAKNTLPKHDGIKSFKNVDTFLKGDIIFGNLEGCFLDSGKSTKCKDTTGNSCFAFRMPERYAGIIKKAGFNLMSIANNHVGDFGFKGRNRTVTLLDSLNIKYAGLQTCPSVIFEKDSVRYAFCAFAPNENTVSINQLDSAKALISSLKSRVNIVIVSFHGGAEGSKFEHVPRKPEIFYKENRGNVYKFAHGVIDAGADVVLGHGPHVTRAVEVYKNKFIAYSLGNFCTYGMFNLSGPSGIAPLLQLKINSSGDFLYADVISVKQTRLNGLTLDTKYGAFKKIQFLTNTDFPKHQLRFSGKGRIELKTN
ncbi:MAG TPA: CapA family protein [Pedobacter sp.]|uniref:CapA family protein n=1 Tax=Pedobacter sp. TaxID=1411316 RepID=UPI002C88DC21|nr:CapA family protein [Pedobacter sp.]HMI04297.1 CapA family protein [Pedobacter sp.]